MYIARLARKAHHVWWTHHTGLRRRRHVALVHCWATRACVTAHTLRSSHGRRLRTTASNIRLKSENDKNLQAWSQLILMVVTL